MKLTPTFKAALAASSLALAACNKPSATQDAVENTHRKTEAILVAHRTTPDEPEGVAILEKLGKQKLYTMLDGGEHTARYFHIFAQDNESQGKNHELAGRLADVQARLATLADLIKEKKIAQKDIEIILNNDFLISGVHESQSPKITVEIQGNVKDFFQNDSSLTVIRKGGDVFLKKYEKELHISIKYS